jgi:uncharacterized protein (TIGR03067 family)
MKSDDWTCDDQLLLAMLDEELPAEASHELLDHVESCPRCQQRISDLAATTEDWQRATVLMADPSYGPGVRSTFEMPALGQHAVHWSEDMARQLLSPPSHPEMLGRLGRYEIERLLGSGGMGVVFKAFDRELNRTVAIKLLAPQLAGSVPARQRFSREARAAAAVMHHHVVPIHNVETEGELPFIVMQYVSGESLQERIDRLGCLELCEVLRIGMQVAAGLAAAHQQGLVHRDIKPSNILLEEEVDRALITDFGLARAADDASLTRPGFHPGTPQYMSPEQASGQSIDARSDLFSLGSMLYTMCAGRPPFRAETSLSVMRRITDAEPTPIRELNPVVPEWLCSVIAKLMAKNPADRYQMATEVNVLLEACLSHVQQPQTIPCPDIPNVARAPESNPFRSLFSGSRFMKTLILAGSLLFLSPLVIQFVRWNQRWTSTRTESNPPSSFATQFRAAEKITDRDQADRAFAALARNAAQAGDVLMTKRAIEHIVRRELESPTQRDCAITLFRQGKHDEAHALAESIDYQPDRDAAWLAFVQSDELPSQPAAEAGSPPPAPSDPPTAVPQKADDLAAIQGTWRVTYSEDSGRVAPQEMLKDLQFRFIESKLITQIGARITEATFQLDSATTPKSIDLTEKGRTKQGIYDLDGDTLRICFAEESKDRPTAFDSKPDSSNDVVIMLKRIKPESANP